MELWLVLGKLIFCSISHFFYEDGTITIVYEELFTRKFGLQSDGPIMSDSTHITFPKFWKYSICQNGHKNCCCKRLYVKTMS